jgi:flagellar hook-associated protein 1 FlgK
MSISGLFDIGRSALTASQVQLGVTGQNIANATTPGYSRQEVILQIATPRTQGEGFVGQGVMVAGIKRIYDNALVTQIQQAQQDYGKSSTISQTLSNVEQIFNESQDLGLATPLTDFFNAWQEVANNPQGITERNVVLQKAATLVSSAKNMEQGINSIQKQTQIGIADDVSQVNALASRIAQLNDQLLRMGNEPSLASNDLRDQRDTALKDLGNLIEMSSWEDNQTGMITVNVAGKPLVSGNTAHPLSTGYDLNGDYALQLGGQDITSKISKGELGGLLSANQNIRSDLDSLRKLVSTVVLTVNEQNAKGFDLDGLDGGVFFNAPSFDVQNNSAAATLGVSITDASQVTLDNYTLKINAGNYELYNQTGGLETSGTYDATNGTTFTYSGIQFNISANAADQDSFTVSYPLSTTIQDFGVAITDPRKLAAAGTQSGSPGDNANALALAALADNTMAAMGDDTFSGYYQSLVGRVGNQSQAASDDMTFSNNFLAQLNSQRDSISGVNMDEEATNLIRFQRAYEAGARLISTADELLQAILNIQ